MNINDLKKLSQKKVSVSNIELLNTIQDKKVRSSEKLTFSFSFFHRENKYFNLGEVIDNWFIDLLNFLEELSNLTWIEILTTHKSKYDAHGYDGNYNVDIFNHLYNIFNNGYQQFQCYQIRINKGKGRVHGFLIGNTYYIIWLDPNHNMYNSPGYPKAKKTEKLKSEYELLEDKNTELTQNFDLINQIFNDTCNDSCPHKVN